MSAYSELVRRSACDIFSRPTRRVHRNRMHYRGRTRLGRAIMLLLLVLFAPWFATRALRRTEHTKRVLTVVFQSKGEWAQSLIGELLSNAFPETEVRYFLSDDFAEDIHGSYDLVVEGCPTFQSMEKIPCRFSTGPWIQFSGEALSSYSERTWCPHDRPATLRLDTSAALSTPAMRKPKVFVWTPYACTYVSDNIQKFSFRNLSGFWSRPHTLAWLSSNCVPFRLHMWEAFYARFTAANLSGIHSLGACAHNRDIIDDHGWWSSDRIYSDYKFVLVFENTFEKGYVTEKLALALAAGAIPIYLGDCDAARLLFSSFSLICVRDLWLSMNRSVGDIPTRADAELAAEEVLHIIKSETAVQKFLLSNVMSTEVKCTERDSHCEDYPNLPFPPSCQHRGERNFHTLRRVTAVLKTELASSRKLPS